MRFVIAVLLVVLGVAVGPSAVRSQTPKESGATPQTIAIRMSNFAYAPEHLRLPAGVPVRLQLTNQSRGGHNLVAPAFFTASSFAPGVVPPQGGKVEVPGGATVEVTLTPRVPGTYPMSCTHFMHSLFGMTGTIEVTGAKS